MNMYVSSYLYTYACTVLYVGTCVRAYVCVLCVCMYMYVRICKLYRCVNACIYYIFILFILLLKLFV